MKYDELMDKECIELCNAINDIPFLVTYSSCCGHGKNTFGIWINAKNLEGLYILARCIDRRYCGPTTEILDKDKNTTKYLPWNLLVEDSDLIMGPIFHLESSSKGDLAYEQAKQIAENIRYTLKDKACMKSWLAGWEEKRE
jgi:hypothetical protein